MRAFYRYFFGLALGVTLVVAGIFALAYTVGGSAPEAGRWTAEILARKAVVARKGARILIVAGSNALFGFSAERIEKVYSISALNLGSNAGLGLRYILDFAKPYLKPGTVVVLPLEYSLYSTPRSNEVEFLHLVGFDFEYFRRLSFVDQFEVLTGTELDGWSKVLKAWRNPDKRRYDGYQSATLNDFGDETANRIEDRNPALVARLQTLPKSALPKISPDAIDLIDAFAEYANEKGARVVVTFPNVLRTTIDFRESRAVYADLAKQLSDHGVPLVGSAEANAFEGEVAFDTTSHQTREGQASSTDRLVADLKAAGYI